MNQNIIAVIIFGGCAIIATIIYALSPHPGRYSFKQNIDPPGSIETIVFDTAKGIEYRTYFSIEAKTYQQTITDFRKLKPMK